MDALNKLIGSSGCQLIVGAGATAIKTGYQAYGCMVRVDNTQILSVTARESDTGATGAVSGESWETVNLLAGKDYISFEDPVVSITLASATHSVMAFLEHYKSE